MKLLKSCLFSLVFVCCIILSGCGTIDVRGKTFIYGGVSINWNNASDNTKENVFDLYQVNNETELLAVLKTSRNRNSRITTFGSDGKYTTKDVDGNILDSGYYEQSDKVIVLADSEEGLKEENVYKIYANEKGYKVRIEIDGEYGIFAEYQYVEKV